MLLSIVSLIVLWLCLCDDANIGDCSIFLSMSSESAYVFSTFLGTNVLQNLHIYFLGHSLGHKQMCVCVQTDVALLPPLKFNGSLSPLSSFVGLCVAVSRGLSCSGLALLAWFAKLGSWLESASVSLIEACNCMSSVSTFVCLSFPFSQSSCLSPLYSPWLCLCLFWSGSLSYVFSPLVFWLLAWLSVWPVFMSALSIFPVFLSVTLSAKSHQCRQIWSIQQRHM